MQKSRLLMRERVGSRDETKVTEGVSRRGGSGHADFLLFSNLLLTRLQPRRARRWGLTTTCTSCRSFAEKQKVSGESRNPPVPPPPSGNPYVTLYCDRECSDKI